MIELLDGGDSGQLPLDRNLLHRETFQQELRIEPHAFECLFLT